MTPIPSSYSLLEKHEPTVEYYAINPHEPMSYIKFGLMEYELGDAEEAPDEYVTGVGLQIDYNPPRRFHGFGKPPGLDTLVEQRHDVFSHGSGSYRFTGEGPSTTMADVFDGTIPKRTDTDAADDPHDDVEGQTDAYAERNTAAVLRETARLIALHTFAYWWYREESDDPLGFKGKRGEQARPQIHSVTADGTLYERSDTETVFGDSTAKNRGEAWETPYGLADIALTPTDKWETPAERATAAFQATIGELEDEGFPPYVIHKGRRGPADILERRRRTKERKEEDRLHDALRFDGVGRRLRRSIADEFDTLDALCEDIREGGTRLRSVRGIGPRRFKRIEDGLHKTDAWIEDDSDTAEADEGKAVTDGGVSVPTTEVLD